MSEAEKIQKIRELEKIVTGFIDNGMKQGHATYAQIHTAMLYASYEIGQDDPRLSDIDGLNKKLHVNENDYKILRIRSSNDMLFLFFTKESGQETGEFSEHKHPITYFQGISHLQSWKKLGETAIGDLNRYLSQAKSILEKIKTKQVNVEYTTAG